MLAGGQDKSRDKWFFDRDVRNIVDAVLRGGDKRLVRWTKESTLTDTRGQVQNEFRLVSDPRIVGAANAISAAGARILARGSDDRSHLVGAVVERLAYKLVARRYPSVDRERKVALTGASSNPLEVVVDDDPFEAYECKYSPARLTQGDLDQLASVRRAATRNGREGIVGVITLESWRSLEQAVSALTIRGDIRHACWMDLLELGDAPASRRLSKSMGATHLRL